MEPSEKTVIRELYSTACHFFNDDPKGEYEMVKKGVYKMIIDSSFGGFRRQSRSGKQNGGQ